MSDSSSSSPSKSLMSSHMRSLIGMTVLAISAIIVLTSGSPGITQERVLQLFTRFDAHVTKEAEKRNKAAEFYYGDIQIEGWGSDKKATVANVTLEMSEKNPVDTQKISFSTERITLENNAIHDGVRVYFPSPVNVIYDSELLYVVSAAKPITYNVHSALIDEVPVLSHGLILPERLLITPALVAGEEEKKQQQIVLASSKNNYLQAKISQETSDVHFTYRLPDMALSYGTDMLFSAENVSGYYTVKQNENQEASGKYELKISDLALNGSAKDRALGVVFEGSYTDADIQMDYKTMRPHVKNIALKVNKAAIIGKDFTVISMGDMVIAEDDPLPYGLLDVEIVNAENLLNDDTIPGVLKPFLEAALKRASGTQGGFAERISIPVKREKNGGLYLGGVTFEEIAAAAFTGFLKTPQPEEEKPAEIARELPPLPEGALPLEAIREASPAGAPPFKMVPESKPERAVPLAQE